jgi:hypothetical protein
VPEVLLIAPGVGYMVCVPDALTAPDVPPVDTVIEAAVSDEPVMVAPDVAVAGTSTVIQ